MIERISEKILTVLSADSRLIAGGNAYASGWPGYKRPDTTADVATAGYVNLFDKSHSPDGHEHRPAIYVGSLSLEATDAEDFPVCSAGARIEYRVMLIPLIVCVQAAAKIDARKQRNQLRHNVKVILLEKISVNGYWYELTIPGGSGGASSERVWTTSSGSGDQAVAEALAVIPVHIRYSWNASCDA